MAHGSSCGWRFLLLTSSTMAMSHCGLAIYIKKYHLKAKEDLWKLIHFTIAKLYLIFRKIL